MRKMQEAADEGKIGRILKMITGGRPPFSLDCIRVGEKNVTDAAKLRYWVVSRVADMFVLRAWI